MKIKNKLIIAALCLAVFVLAFCLCSIFNNKEAMVASRDIKVDEIGTLSYEEKADMLKNKFSRIVTEEDETHYNFTGEIDIDQVELLSTGYEGEQVKEVYSSKINKESDSVVLGKEVVVEGEVVSSFTQSYDTFYDEKTDTFYLVGENGEKIDILAELDESKVNECFALTLFLCSLTVKQIITICVVTAVSIAIIANADAIAAGVDELVSGVRDGVTSFWERIKLRFGKITAIALKSTIAFLTLAQAKAITEKAKKRKDCYLLLAPVSPTEPLAILYKFTNFENARNWVKKGGSIWAPYSVKIREVFGAAGYSAGGFNKAVGAYVVNVYEHHESKLGLLTFNHYHTLKGNRRVNQTCHGFFGLPY